MIDHLSFCSVFIEFFFQKESESPLAIGTGFTIKANDKNEWFLVTNWHCVTGRHPVTNNPLSQNGLSDPEIAKVHFHSPLVVGNWVEKTISLINEDGSPSWIEHDIGSEIDVVIIPLEQSDDIKLYNISEAINGNDLLTQPSDDVSIIGFPNGLTGCGKFPIWKTGNIATDFYLDWNDKPLFLIDATTRKGMSGSPVIMIKEGLCRFERNNLISGRFGKFMGIYSGRIDNTTEIGQVWKPITLIEIMNKFYR